MIAGMTEYGNTGARESKLGTVELGEIGEKSWHVHSKSPSPFPLAFRFPGFQISPASFPKQHNHTAAFVL